MSSAPFLFVYGTLMSICPRSRYSRLLAQEAELVGSALIPGRLYAWKRHPALRPAQSAADQAAGELYRLPRPSKTLAVLDSYEGTDYIRVRTRATLASGRSVQCWTYVYVHAMPRARQIPSGEWRPGESGYLRG